MPNARRCVVTCGLLAALVAAVPTPASTHASTKERDPSTPIVDGVSVAGVLVGGMTVSEARALVVQWFQRPIRLRVSPTKKFVFTPEELGAVANFDKALSLAGRVRQPGFFVPLDVSVAPARLMRALDLIAGETAIDPVDARLRLVGFEPRISSDRPGRRLQQLAAAREIRHALKTHARDPLQLPFEEVKAKTGRADFGPIVVIRRESKELRLYINEKLKRTFRVATGQSSYPTPLGRFEVTTKQRHPWWYPPTTSDWAKGKEPVPPGPGNPLGTRWMGISSPYVGIHGTPDSASIGYSASHGCVRMLVPEAEWLFERIEVGTPVFIVRG